MGIAAAMVKPEITFKLDGIKGIRSVFIANREFCGLMTNRINPSRITVGNKEDLDQNSICADDISDGGWYECGEMLTGEYLRIYRTSNSGDFYNFTTVRAYSGINVLKDATVFQEPAEHTTTESASNLIR